MSEKSWKERLAKIGCIVCRHFDQSQHGRTTLHHIREGQGMSQKADNFLLVPLCHLHHQGGHGWHTLQKGGFYNMFKADELDLLAWTLRAMDGGTA
jgi:hypothetical protein